MSQNNSKDMFKNITDLGKKLVDLAGVGKNLSEQDISEKPIKQVGITESTFSDIADLGNKLNAMAKFSTILMQLGIDKDMITKGLDMAKTLMNVGNLGKESIEKEDNNTLSDIGLNLETFKNIDKMGNTLKDFESLKNKVSGAEDKKSSSDMEKVMDGIGSVLNMFNKK